jgi:hypothetical protein
LKSQQTLATATFLTHFIISIAVRENVPLTQGYRKETLFHTKRRSGWDRESNPGQATCVAGSVARRSAIHYAFTGTRVPNESDSIFCSGLFFRYQSTKLS